MSRLTDGLRLLDEEAIALAFLPVINFTYIVWHLPDPGWVVFGAAVLAAPVSAATYNLYLHIDFSSFESSQYGEFERREDGTPYKKGKEDVIGARTLVVCGVFTISWAALLIYSLYHLVLLDTESIWRMALIVVSTLVVCIVSTGMFFVAILSPYEVGGASADSPDIDRIVDEQAGVVIYTITPPGNVEPVIEVVPIDETDLDIEAITNADSSKGIDQ